MVADKNSSFHFADFARAGVFTIPAGRPFAQDLASGILAAVHRPEELAAVKILLPSRRAAQALKTAFIQQSDGQALFLPDMQPIGDVDELDPEFLSLTLTTDELGELPPAASMTDRHIVLARLIQSRPIGGQRLSPAQSFRLAASLARFLDQVYQAGGSVEALDEAVIPSEFARHWADILTFLSIILKNWPDITQERGVMDPSARRLALLDRQLRQWAERPPETPVLLAGSTGSLPKTVDVMRAIRQLPKGVLVFPGHDGEVVSEDDHTAILGDVGHPMHQLFTTFAELGLAPDDVPLWPVCARPPAEVARAALMKQVFLPSEQTAQWRQIARDHPEITAEALSGLRLIEADDTHHEADIIACLMRQTLDTPQQTAMLVTPDRQLARQVRAALMKWELDVDDSAGIPLPLSRTGHYLQLIAEWAQQDGSAQALLALIKHPLASGGLAPARFRQLGRQLEKQVLRGYLKQSDRDGITAMLQADPAHRPLLAFYETHILKALSPLTEAFANKNITLDALAEAHGQAAEQLAQTDIENQAVQALWSRDDGVVAARLLGELAASGGSLPVQTKDYADLFHVLASQQIVRSAWRSHPRLAILGTVEARMQTADHIILAGVNEGSWPPVQDFDPWTNQPIRTALNLPDRRWRVGLSAHDFVMQVCTSHVTITRARRADDSPTTPSRWLERLKAVLAAARLTERLESGIPKDILAALGHHLNQPVLPVAMPAPRPEIAVRPRQFSATEFDSWISDPYFIYAKKILKLRPLQPVDKRPDAALRGTLTHKALAEFIEQFPSGDLPDNAAETLYRIGEAIFAPYFWHPPIKAFWLARFRVIADWFIHHERGIRTEVVKTLVEKKGQISLDARHGPVIVSATADRLDIHADGRLSIIDYKTGATPSKAKVENRRATQLLIEAVIAQSGGFAAGESLTPQGFKALEYWQLSGSLEKAARITPVLPSGFDAEQDRQYLSDLICKYDDADQPYLPEPNPHDRPAYSDYRHLSRVREWRPQEVDDD